MTQLTKKDFLERLEKALGKPLDEKMLTSLHRALGTDEEIERLVKYTKSFQSGMHREGITEYYDVADARARINDQSKALSNWLFDRQTNMLIVNLKMGRHEALMSHLYQAYIYGDIGFVMDEHAEEYLKAGMGFFLTANRGYGPPMPMKSELCKLTPQEKIIFKRYEFHSMNIRGQVI